MKAYRFSYGFLVSLIFATKMYVIIFRDSDFWKRKRQICCVNYARNSFRKSSKNVFGNILLDCFKNHPSGRNLSMVSFIKSYRESIWNLFKGDFKKENIHECLLRIQLKKSPWEPFRNSASLKKTFRDLFGNFLQKFL